MNNFLSRIDWQNHDGVNIPMINDFVRNQFYDKILKDHVGGKRCIDIGFGTGLLSLLAIKHGAEHVVAYENNQDRYQLGQYIIDQLNLNDRIKLINDTYYSDHATQHNASVIFSETVNGNLWWEGLFASLPTQTGYTFLPGEYFLELFSVEVPESFAAGLTLSPNQQRRFNPGVDLDYNFVSTVNSLIGQPPPPPTELTPGIINFERQQETDWGWIPYMRAAVSSNSVAAKYVINANTRIIHTIGSNREEITVVSKDKKQVQLEIDTAQWANKTVLIVPRVGMGMSEKRLYLDTGHWGPTENPIILHRPTKDLVVTHNLQSGIITYSLKD